MAQEVSEVTVSVHLINMKSEIRGSEEFQESSPRVENCHTCRSNHTTKKSPGEKPHRNDSRRKSESYKSDWKLFLIIKSVN